MYCVVSTPRTVAVPVLTTRVLDAEDVQQPAGSRCSSPSPNASSDSPLRTATHGLRAGSRNEAGGQAHVERRVDGAASTRAPAASDEASSFDPAGASS